MPNYRLSKPADADLAGIADYTIERFGLQQARIYRDRMFNAFAALAAFPDLGTDCSHIVPGTRRFAHEAHVLYFRKVRSGIVILRILGKDQDPYENF